MSNYDNTNRGAIWKNDDKQDDKHPDFKGSLNVGGVEYWVSAWKRRDDASPKSPSLSFSVKPKEEKRAAPATRKSDPISTGRPKDMDDEIPFLMEWRG